MLLTGVLYKSQCGFALSISTDLSNQLTGLPAFTGNYATQVMAPFWSCSAKWHGKYISIEHTSISQKLHLVFLPSSRVNGAFWQKNNEDLNQRSPLPAVEYKR